MAIFFTECISLRVREGGEATRYFWIVGTAIRWLLLLLLILTLIWLAVISPPQEEPTTAFLVSSLGLSYTFSKTNFSKCQETYFFIAYIYKLLST